jgi:hypothetical protein
MGAQCEVVDSWPTSTRLIHPDIDPRFRQVQCYPRIREILLVLIINSALRGTHVLDYDEKESVADLLVLIVFATP